LADVGQQITWLQACSVAAVWRQLRRLKLSYTLAQRFVNSPDPAYDDKWRRILGAYADAVSHPQAAVLLFADELTYYRRPTLKRLWQRQGQRVRHLLGPRSANTRTRLVAGVEAVRGRLHSWQRSTIGRAELCAWLKSLRQAYPQLQRLYVVWDNWPLHAHPDVQQTARQLAITLLFLPTYASWLNPVERLWRWLRTDLLHNFEPAEELHTLRSLVLAWLERFAEPSPHLLYRIGLLSKPELDSLCRLNC
jgi:transposase